MKLLVNTTDYEETISLAPEASAPHQPITFHTYWKGSFTEKHLLSIVSCRKVHPQHKIIIWTEDLSLNEISDKLQYYASIHPFTLSDHTRGTFLENYVYEPPGPWSYSNYVRSVLLFVHGGCWFDLDCLFLRSFDPLFTAFGSEICAYQWEKQNHPFYAIYFCLEAKSERMKKNMEFIIAQNKGWSPEHLTYDMPLDMTVLPCSWFDGGWIENPHGLVIGNMFGPSESKYTLDTFFKGAFCFHWHNQWTVPIDESSLAKMFAADS
jgi:hypothetical protein